MQVRDADDITTANLYWCAVAFRARACCLLTCGHASRMDLNRIKYLLRAYLRVRLAKVQAWLRLRDRGSPSCAFRLTLCSRARSNLRSSLQIEEHVLHTIKEEHLFNRLSPQEQEFAKG